jgi:hypothetical protein
MLFPAEAAYRSHLGGGAQAQCEGMGTCNRAGSRESTELLGSWGGSLIGGCTPLLMRQGALELDGGERTATNGLDRVAG